MLSTNYELFEAFLKKCEGSKLNTLASNFITKCQNETEISIEKFFADSSEETHKLILKELDNLKSKFFIGGLATKAMIKIFAKHATPSEQIQILDILFSIQHIETRYSDLAKVLCQDSNISLEVYAHIKQHMKSQDHLCKEFSKLEPDVLQKLKQTFTEEQLQKILTLRSGENVWKIHVNFNEYFKNQYFYIVGKAEFSILSKILNQKQMKKILKKRFGIKSEKSSLGLT